MCDTFAMRDIPRQAPVPERRLGLMRRIEIPRGGKRRLNLIRTAVCFAEPPVGEGANRRYYSPLPHIACKRISRL
jgi:hypothetical protein